MPRFDPNDFDSTKYNLTLVEYLVDTQACTLKTCPIELAYLNYLPNVGGNAFFLALFSILLLLQLFIGVKHKMYGFAASMFCGLLLEILGYIARIKLHDNPFDNDTFLLYIVTITIAPAFISGGIYFCLAHIVKIYGAHISRIPPYIYSIIFIGCDVFALVLQAAGGGLANSNNRSIQNTGINIMIAGLSFQVFSLILFMLLSGEFFFRVYRHRDQKSAEYAWLRETFKFRAFLYALGLATITIFIRSVFRVAELREGFDGKLANDQVDYMVLEPTMVAIAVLALTIFHPAFAFQGTWGKIPSKSVETARSTTETKV